MHTNEARPSRGQAAVLELNLYAHYDFRRYCHRRRALLRRSGDGPRFFARSSVDRKLGRLGCRAYYLYPYLVPYAKKYTDDDRIAIIGSAAVVFLVALIVISFITMRIADFIIDSRIGALDRTLGFLFGAARGILLLVVAVAFWNWLVDAGHRPDWVNNAKSKPFLDSMVVKLQSVLPEEFAQMVRASVLDKVQPQAQGTERQCAGRRTGPGGRCRRLQAARSSSRIDTVFNSLTRRLAIAI